MDNMMDCNYSIIIPHHNSPELLIRCLESIPQRDDIQVIVVDDNSDKTKKPIIQRSDVEIYYIDKDNSQGAGYARNVALSQARGKWLLFSDADDFYTEGFINVLDEYINSEYDVIYFNIRTVYSKTLKPAERGHNLNRIIADFDDSRESRDLIKYKVHAPWNKMVRKNYVDQYGFKFEHVPNGNDTMFTYQIGYFTEKIKVLPDTLYTYTVNPDSITHKKRTQKTLLSNLCNLEKNSGFYEFIGHEEWYPKHYILDFIKRYAKSMNFRAVAILIYTYIMKHKYISEQRYKYVNVIKQFNN